MIPRIFHRIWVGPPMPEAFKAFWDTWQAHHPEWEFWSWEEDELARLEIRNRALYDQAAEICPGFEGQLKGDVARLEILAQYGGVYVDADFECLRPIEPLLEGVGCFFAWEIQGEVANNAVIGAEAGHPFIENLVDELPTSVCAGAGLRPSKISGPHFVTRRLKAWRGSEEIAVFRQDQFYPYACNELHRAGEAFPDAYAVHHWGNQRRLRNRPL